MKDYGAKIDGSLQEMKCSSPENQIGHPVTDIEEGHLHWHESMHLWMYIFVTIKLADILIIKNDLIRII